MKQNDTKNLRFAALIRVSTEQQERTGESLRTQRKEIEEAVRALGGEIVDRYGGAEHATPGFEKKEVDRLLTDAARPHSKFNAVMVAHQDRWSRDNGKSSAGLELFREKHIRFFVRETEQNLFDETCRMYLGISAVIGEYHALTQSKRSIVNRINRAKRGVPTCGKLPYGRTYDATNGWAVDGAKQKQIVAIAKRYLAGERLPELAREFSMNHSNLHKILTRRAGTLWEQTFASKRLNIDDVVITSIPELLPPKTIAAIKERVEKNRTYERGRRKDDTTYLLGRRVFCAHCGYAMFGQLNHGKRRYYRHNHARRERECTGPKSWVPAESLEWRVMDQLFEVFGNPLAMKRAIEEATPNLERIKESEQRITTLEKELAKKASARQKILQLITDDVITKVDAEKQLAKLKEDDVRINEELSSLQSYLGNLPTPASIRRVADVISKKFGRLRYASSAEVKLAATKRLIGAGGVDAMTWEEKRSLVETVFDGKTPDGRRMGVYIQWKSTEARLLKWSYQIRGVVFDGDGCIADDATVKNALY